MNVFCYQLIRKLNNVTKIVTKELESLVQMESKDVMDVMEKFNGHNGNKRIIRHYTTKGIGYKLEE